MSTVVSGTFRPFLGSSMALSEKRRVAGRQLLHLQKVKFTLLVRGTLLGTRSY